MIPRRAMLAAGPLALAGCGKAEDAYFGRTEPPNTQRLVYLLGSEPGTLDPTMSFSPNEAAVIHAMFEGLTSFDPGARSPVPSLATHFHVTSDGLRYTFWLTGHERSQVPARWSDGRAITAHDFVYSWRRAATPATAAPYGYLFAPFVNGRAIADEKKPPEELGVRALDDFSLEVRLESSVPFFPRLLAMRQFYAVPSQAIERHGSAWTDPGNIVTSGPFTLRERRPYDRILLVKNPHYREARETRLDEILFQPVVDGATSANLYRAGEASFTMALDPTLRAGLRAALIRAGTRKPDELGMRALDDFALEVELRTPAPFFLQMVSHRVFCAVPRRAVEAHGTSWTVPANIVVSGAFLLRERRPNERIVLGRNPHYYEAGNVAMEEIAFFPVVNGSTAVNLYRTGDGSLVQALLPRILPALRRKKDFRIDPNFGTIFPLINTARPPFSDVRVRYALNMAIDKRAVADFAGAGQTAVSSLVPRSLGYDPPKTLPLSIDGIECDVLAFNPREARELFGKATGNRRPVRVEFLYPNLPDARPVAEILQQQWKQTLGIDLILVNRELQIWLQNIFSKEFKGIALWGDLGGFADPAWFLDQFTETAAVNVTGWTDPRYDRMIGEAAAMRDRAERMRKLSDCERYLLGAMPFLPLYNWVTPYLCKPFVRGFGPNPLDFRQWKYVWIATNWRAS